MEDPSSEWEMEEYYSPEDGQSKVSRILDKGFWLGQKILITGVVISSAPLFLPPLVVISALGFAVSVPFGVVFASYACTEKLISKLLPPPEPPLMLDYENGGEIGMEKEEEEQKGDMKCGVEMRIELVEKGSEGPREEVLPEYKDVSVEEGGYEEKEVKIEGIKEEGEGEIVIEISRKGVEKDEKLPIEDVSGSGKEETIGLIEKMSDEGNVESVAKEVGMVPAGERDKNVISVEKMDTPFEVKQVKMERFSRKKKGKKGKKAAEAHPSKDETRERNEENAGIVPTEVKPVEEVEATIHGDEDKNKADNALAVEGTYGDSNGRRLGRVVQSKEDEQKPPVDNKSAMQGVKGKDQAVTDVHEGLRSEKEKKNDVSRGSGDNVAVGIAEILEPPASAGVPKSKHAGISFEMTIKSPSNEVMLSEEKIWEKIDALRTIVGYKVAAQSTCLEELKALYIFTGVEPPASFKNPSDIAELNHNLRFLMAIVGVK